MVAMWESRSPPDHSREPGGAMGAPGSPARPAAARLRRSAGRDIVWIHAGPVAQVPQLTRHVHDGIAPAGHPITSLGQLRLISGLESGRDGAVRVEQSPPGPDVDRVNAPHLGSSGLV